MGDELLVLDLENGAMTICSACRHFEPRDWCWEGRMDCPFVKPPRVLNVSDLWARLVEHEKRIAALENPPT